MPARILPSLLQRLRRLRIDRGLTQEAFAEGAHISYKYYQAIEAGRKPDLRLSTLERLARAHGLEVWQLLQPSDIHAPAGARVRIGKRVAAEAMVKMEAQPQPEGSFSAPIG